MAGAGVGESPLKRQKPEGNNEEAASKSGPPVESGCMEGLSAAELIMIQRLAGNDPGVRKKTLKKLKKWLKVVAMKVSDSPDCRPVVEANFIRIWKALFYCMWMSDKPLAQEQLAESISDLQFIFASNTKPFLLFVEWFLRTMAREWNWIDRFRMDKYMMMFRRFFRKSLIVIAEKKWHNDVLEGFLKIISTYLFNRHPKTKVKNQGSIASPVKAPMGLQIHFTDIFMEELAKVGGEALKFQKTLKIIAPFMYELGYSDDERLLGEIRERIFNHLMRQSDVAMDYEEQLTYQNVEQNEEEDLEAPEEDDELIQDEKQVGFQVGNGLLDPRAGADAILPQLDVDYELLYKKLIEFGGQKDLRLKNRRILYSLGSQFREITEGKYPFAIPEEDTRKPAVSKKDLKKAAERLNEGENMNGSGRKLRKNKKQRKRDAMRRRLDDSQQSMDSVGSEDESQFIHDNDLLDHVTDNYVSYIATEVEEKSVPGESENESQEMDVVDGEVEETPRKKQKDKEKNRKRKWKTVVEVEADEENVIQLVDQNAEGSEKLSNSEEVVLIKKPKLKKRNSMSSVEISSSTPLKGKAQARRVSELCKTPLTKPSILNRSVSNSGNRRVSFVLAKNLEHEHADYPVSIARSPAIPFDSGRRPSFGVLKSPATPKNQSAFRKRASAIDFF